MTSVPATEVSPVATYARAILAQVPRVLGMMDREAFSGTVGCCDRTYWGWKFVDFPRSRFQEALCVLGFLYATPLDESPYAGNPHLLEWIGYGLRFWTTIQHPDGSFDEAYPYERSLAATAFTTFYVAEALTFAGAALPADQQARGHAALRRAGEWLLHNDETHGFLSNHLAAAAAALQHVYRFTGEAAFAQRSAYFIDRILSHQSAEGWYDEYGGADPGYQTHGSFYLARYWQMTGRSDVRDSLARANRFLAHFVHADGSIGGEYASRNTQTYYPAAFAMLASHDPAAAWIAAAMHASVTSGAAAGLHGVDAYNYFPFLNNLVFAYLACSAGPPPARPAEPAPGAGLLWFPEAGIARIRHDRYDAYVGVGKGGVIKVFDRQRRKLIYSDGGYIGRLRNGRLLSTQHQDRGWPIHVALDRIELAGPLAEVSRPTMTPVTFVAFRLFALTVGRLAWLGRWLKRRLVTVLIYRKRALRIRFTRTIALQEARIIIDDVLEGPDAARVAELRWEPQFTTIHMGSSRYFITNELTLPATLAGSPHAIDPARLATGVNVRRIVDLDDVQPGST